MAFCKTVRSKIKKILRKFTGYVEDHVNVALEVTARLKKILKNPIASIAVALIPGDFDNELRKKVLEGLEYVIPALKIVKDCEKKESLDEKLQCFVAELNKREPELQDAILHKMASLLAKFLDDGREADNIYDLFVQAKYSVQKDV